jgi:hypothetical protein
VPAGIFLLDAGDVGGGESWRGRRTSSVRVVPETSVSCSWVPAGANTFGLPAERAG